MNTEVEEMIGDETNLTKIKLTSGDTIPADVCLVGIGESHYIYNNVQGSILGIKQ